MKESSSLPHRVEYRDTIYRDEYQHLYRVVAHFDSFVKEYQVSDHGHRVGLLVLKEGEVLLLRQYRLLINGLSWEIPGGRVDEGETPEQAAIRECREEAGVECTAVQLLINYQAGLDIVKNPTQIYYSCDFTDLGDQACLPRAWVPLEQCLKMVFEQQITDTLSIIALLAYKTTHGRHGKD